MLAVKIWDYSKAVRRQPSRRKQAVPQYFTHDLRLVYEQLHVCSWNAYANICSTASFTTGFYLHSAEEVEDEGK